MGKEGILQLPIQFKEVAPYMSALHESKAIEMIKELAEKAADVKDPTNWLIAAAKRGKQYKGSNEFSKRIGELNKKNVLKSPVMWTSVCGPLLLINDEEANALIDELEQKAADIKSP